MIDTAGLIQDLESLLDSCGVIEGLDKAVEYRSNTSMREAIVEAVDKIVQSVDESYRKQALVPLLMGTFLVHSRTNSRGISNLSVEHDTNIRGGLDPRGDSWTSRIDSGVDRYTYYGEFGLRVARLREEILQGRLDVILGLDPTLILHGISGLRGELLPALGWDPLKGETYTRSANDLSMKMMKDIDDTYERIARSRARTSATVKVVQNLIKTLQPTTNNTHANTIVTKDSHANAIVTNDYKVHPLDLPPENMSKSGNQAETKTPAPEPIGIIGFTLTDRIATDMGLAKETRGVLVIGVLPNSFAEKAGLRAGTIPTMFDGTEGMLGGDIINGIEDTPINNKEELKLHLTQYHIHGKKIKFNVLRNGKPVDIEIVY